MTYILHKFALEKRATDIIRSMTPAFGYDGFGEFIFYRTYSRNINGHQEDWADCVIRVTNGVFSIRKDWYIKNRIRWDESFWQTYARMFAISMFRMHWLPPGRGLWAMGTDFIVERGAMALYNCAFTELGPRFHEDLEWLMDSLMHGVGVGFSPIRDDNLKLQYPKGTYVYQIADTREAWCESVALQIKAFMEGSAEPVFDYSLVRPAGLPIKGFGGLASGPEPLVKLHQRINKYCYRYINEETYDSVMLKTDLANIIGCCVVAGNVRRSAEIGLAPVSDPVFGRLKDYSEFPYRAEHGWMSNNSVVLKDDEDFERLGYIAHSIIENGEPGFLNLQNIKHGRIGKNGCKIDKAIGLNPCGEIPLESRETCNVVETCPTVCESIEDWYRACDYATFYASTVSLLPTHQPSTNRIVARNRRIGVSIIDFSGWKHEVGLNKVTKYLREGYGIVKNRNSILNAEAGVPEAIRVTTIKPGGTGPKLPGKTPGIGNPTFRATLRRVRVQQNSPIHRILAEANIPYEKDFYSDNTDVFEWPIMQGPAKPAYEVPLYEQAMNLVLVQREWADNAVSNTLYFKPKWKLIAEITENFEQIISLYHISPESILYGDQEWFIEDEIKIKAERAGDKVYRILVYEYDPTHEEDDIEPVLAAIAPLTKSVSMLPHSAVGVYKQMPEEGITEEEYNERRRDIRQIDWKSFNGSDGLDEKFCDSGHCQIPARES